MLAAVTTGWVVGWAIGAAVVVVVVVLVGAILALAARIVRQAQQIDEALHAADLHTDSLWELSEVNVALDRIAESATATRPGGSR